MTSYLASKISIGNGVYSNRFCIDRSGLWLFRDKDPENCFRIGFEDIAVIDIRHNLIGQSVLSIQAAGKEPVCIKGLNLAEMKNIREFILAHCGPRSNKHSQGQNTR